MFIYIVFSFFLFWCFFFIKKTVKRNRLKANKKKNNNKTKTKRRQGEQWQVGSLSGADASQRVTEACEGNLKLDGNQL